MSRPDASPEALTLARACLHVRDAGPHRVDLIYLPPGGDLDRDGILWGSPPSKLVEWATDRAAAQLAPLVDLGIAHERSKRPAGFFVPMPPLPGLTPPTPAEALTSEVCVQEDDGEVEGWAQSREDALRPEDE